MTYYRYEVSRPCADMLRYDRPAVECGQAVDGWTIVESRYAPTIGRWASFGIRVRNVAAIRGKFPHNN